MQARLTARSASPSRRGFTLIELLVVISIIATLVALILPAIQAAREAARRTQCLNNIRNITLGTIAFAESRKGNLPASGTYKGVDTNGDGLRDTVIRNHNWVVEILPNLDSQALYDRWNFDQAFNDTNNLAIGTGIGIAVLACPNDDTASGKDGGLSYVANCGVGDGNIDVGSAAPSSFTVVPTTLAMLGHCPAMEPLDWDGDTTAPTSADSDLSKDLGVFGPRIECDVQPTTSSPAPSLVTKTPSANIGKIYDGGGNTIMFGENVNAGKDLLNGVSAWSDPSLRSCGFFFGVDAGAPGVYGNLPAITYTPVAGVSGNRYMNKEKNGIDGAAPSANSRHQGIAVFSFCDGSAKPLAETIDAGIYARLLTPAGARPRTIGGFFPETPLSQSDF